MTSDMQKNIAIVAGGYSSEYEVSIGSAVQVKNNLDQFEEYRNFIIQITDNEWFYEEAGHQYPVDKSNFSLWYNDTKLVFDCVFIAIHGTPGEDGLLQSYFELLHIPYTSCDQKTAFLTFNKFACKAYLDRFGIRGADYLMAKKRKKPDYEAIQEKIGFPCFVKPNNSGSSFGVSKVSDGSSLEAAFQKAWEEDDEAIIEQCISGQEFACGVFQTPGKSYVLPVTEIISENEFFDYEAKYKGKSKEVTPAVIPDKLKNEIQESSEKIYRLVNCHGLARVDFLYDGNQLYFLEINTVPGLSKESIVPQQIRAAGYTVPQFYKWMLEEAMGRV